MGYIVGIVLALFVCGLARVSGLDRDRAFYTAMAFTVASYYVLFAAMSGSTQTLMIESIVTTVFVLVALIGFLRNLWLVVASLGGHGVFDAVHDFLCQPLDALGKPGSREATHIPLDYQGPLPAWPK